MPLDTPSVPLKVEAWVQYSNYKLPKKNTNSAPISATVPISKAPIVDFNYPTERNEYGYEDIIPINLGIQDEGTISYEVKFGGISAIKKEGIRINNNERIIPLQLQIPEAVKFNEKHPTVNCEIIVKDEFNQETKDIHSFTLRSKPVITLLDQLPGDTKFVPGESFPVRCWCTAKTIPQHFCWYYSFDDGKYVPGHSYYRYTSANKWVTPKIVVPSGMAPGPHIVKIMMSSRQNLNTVPRTPNSDSEEKSFTVEVTKTPILRLDEFMQKVYSNGGRLQITGTIEGYGSIKIKVNLDNQELEPINDYVPNGKLITTISKRIYLPEKMAFGAHQITFQPFSSGHPGKQITRTINIKNKPRLISVTSSYPDYGRGGDFIGYATLTDYDVSKPLYIYGQLPDEKPFILFSGKSTGEEEREIFLSGTFDTKHLGKVEMKIWATDIQDPNKGDDLDKSEVRSVQFILTDVLRVKVTFPTSRYHTSNETIETIVEVQDDDFVILKVQIDTTEISALEERIDSKSVLKRQPKSIPLNNLEYGPHFIFMYVEDSLGYVSEAEFYSFTVINYPKIEKVQFERSYAILNEVIDFNLTFSDYDYYKPLYIYLQIGDKDILNSIHSLYSPGKMNHELTIGLFIDKDEKPGTYPVKIWMSNSNRPFKTDNYIKKSEVYETTLVIAYRPTLEIRQPNRAIYADGEKIPIVGTISSFSNLILKYRIEGLCHVR